MSTSSRRALVVGAGIGGLAAGLALRHAGWDIQIFERAKSPRELGFALLLAPNAMSALRELGLKNAVLAGGVVARRGEIRRPNGDVLRRLDVSTVHTHLGEETAAVLRPLLYGALLNVVDTEVLALESELVSFRRQAAGVEIALADGRRVSDRILIGADGVGSMVRKQLHPEERAPRPSGLCALRGVADGVAHHLGQVSSVQYFGRGIEAGLMRVSPTAVYWYLSLAATDVSRPTDARALLERTIAGFHKPFRTIVMATLSDNLRVDELLERDPLDQWGSGAVTLLGDAAHPMLPHAGQGAAQALEDAVVLGQALRPSAAPEVGLRRYERTRTRRTDAVVRLARRNARFGSLRSRPACWLRDLMVRLVPEAVLLRSLIALGLPQDELDP
jgi:2-polyprenyl-6-methoxyphenol hydroxylase-like FAD-dependent oxidoreductase